MISICMYLLSFLSHWPLNCPDRVPSLVGSMDNLKITHALAAGMLAMGQRNLHCLFAPILHLTRWQQTPVAHLLVTFLPLISMILEVPALSFVTSSLDFS